MKQVTLITGMLLLSAVAFAQDCPTSLKRNNGNGVCNGQGQLTLNYASCPTSADIIDSVYVNGVKYEVTFGPPSACNGAQYSVSYCITSGNMPPTGTWRIFFHNITVIGGFNCVIPDGGPLPVKMNAFYARRINSTVSLSWITETEHHAKEFIIQRKTGTGFVDIATIPAANKATGSQYTYTDNNNSKSTSQYRLKIVDLDEQFVNSDIRTVKGTAAVSDFTLFPNPSTGNARVTITDISEATDVQLIDNTGRLLKTVSMNNSNTVNLDNLQKGMYMIRIVNKTSGESLVKKLTVLK